MHTKGHTFAVIPYIKNDEKSLPKFSNRGLLLGEFREEAIEKMEIDFSGSMKGGNPRKIAEWSMRYTEKNCLPAIRLSYANPELESMYGSFCKDIVNAAEFSAFLSDDLPQYPGIFAFHTKVLEELYKTNIGRQGFARNVVSAFVKESAEFLKEMVENTLEDLTIKEKNGVFQLFHIEQSEKKIYRPILLEAAFTEWQKKMLFGWEGTTENLSHLPPDQAGKVLFDSVLMSFAGITKTPEENAEKSAIKISCILQDYVEFFQKIKGEDIEQETKTSALLTEWIRNNGNIEDGDEEWIANQLFSNKNLGKEFLRFVENLPGDSLHIQKRAEANSLLKFWQEKEPESFFSRENIQSMSVDMLPSLTDRLQQAMAGQTVQKAGMLHPRELAIDAWMPKEFLMHSLQTQKIAIELFSQNGMKVKDYNEFLPAFSDLSRTLAEASYLAVVGTAKGEEDSIAMAEKLESMQSLLQGWMKEAVIPEMAKADRETLSKMCGDPEKCKLVTNRIMEILVQKSGKTPFITMEEQEKKDPELARLAHKANLTISLQETMQKIEARLLGEPTFFTSFHIEETKKSIDRVVQEMNASKKAEVAQSTPGL